MNRRGFLSLAGGLAASAAGVGALSGCSTRPPVLDVAGPPAAAPRYQQRGGLPTPDIAGTPDGVIPSTYLRYPDQPVVTVPTPPGDGRPVTVLTQTFSPIPPAVSNNSVWSNLNARLGSPLQIQLVPQADYKIKFATVVAGDTLPDLFFASPDFPRLPELLAARAVDLTEHLSGDAILTYPNLANLPTACWDVGRFNGRLYGLPSPRGAAQSGVLLRRDDLLAKRGIQGEVSSYDEFAGVCREVNNPRSGVWALTAVPLQFIRNMLAIPNFWRFDGGSMLSWWTAPEQEQALEAGRRLFADGLVNPDAFAAPNKKTWFSTGKAYFTDDAIASWPQYYSSVKDDSFDMSGCAIPAFNGGGTGKMWLSFPSYGFAAVGQHAADRVQTMLRIADYLAAPFGSAEYLTVRYGVPGTDYEIKDGNPSLSKSGSASRELGVKFVTDAPIVNFIPGRAAAARKLDQLLRQLVPAALANDAVYLYSKTAADRFAGSQTRFSNLENDILQGRRPVSDWRAEADSWWSRYGSRMSAELTEAYHAAGRG